MIRLRATCALLALLFGALVAPVTLATQTTEEVCAMACCIEEKHCCCKPAKLAVKGQKRDAAREQLSGAEISTPCPEGCATSPASSKFHSRALLRPAGKPFALLGSVTIHAPPLVTRLFSVALRSTSPRAPPSPLNHFSA
jgi:hypothetical protein